jgi:proteasome lid subunit RPN8/RPN11
MLYCPALTLTTQTKGDNPKRCSERQAMIHLLHALKTGDPLPAQVSFDFYSTVWFDSLWRLSLIQIEENQPPVKEHGAVLVEKKGSLTVAVARPGKGDAFDLDDSEMQFTGFIGYFHTHPYESGTTEVAFSSADFAAMINNQMSLLIVQSGISRFMLVRTPATPTSVPPAEISTKFSNSRRYYKRQGVNFQDEVRLANIDICYQYQLAFYEGKMHQFLRRSV